MENSDDFLPSDIINLLPENHRFYLYLGIAKLMEFPVIAEHLIKEFNKNEKYTSLVENTGIEPLEDINFLTLSNNKTKEDPENYNYCVVLHSRYDKEKLLSHFEKKENGNDELFVSTSSEHSLFLTFIKESILVFSNSKKIVEDIIDKKGIQNKEKKPGILSCYVRKETILGVGIVIDNVKKDENIFNIPFNIFKSIEFISLFLHQDKEDFIITAHLIYGDKEYVELVSGLVKGVTGILAKQVEFQEVKDFLEDIRIEEEPEGLTLILRLTKKNLDKLFEFLKEKNILDKKMPVTEDGDKAKPGRSAAE